MVIKYKMQMSAEASKLLIMTTISYAFTSYKAHAKYLECIHLFNDE